MKTGQVANIQGNHQPCLVLTVCVNYPGLTLASSFVMAHAASQRVGGRRVAQKVRRRHDQHAQDVEEHRGGDADRQRLQRSPSRQLTEEETDQLRKNFEARFPQFTAEQREEFIQGIVRRAAGGPTRRIVLPGPPPASPSRATRKERSINDVSTGKICKLFCTVMLIVACLIAFLVWCFWHSKLLHISLVKDDVNYFEILGLDASASAREIRQHYRKLARQ